MTWFSFRRTGQWVSSCA